MAYKVIQVGTGGQGRAWCQRFLPPNIADGLIEVVAAVDVNEAALVNAQEESGVQRANAIQTCNARLMRQRLTSAQSLHHQHFTKRSST